VSFGSAPSTQTHTPHSVLSSVSKGSRRSRPSPTRPLSTRTRRSLGGRLLTTRCPPATSSFGLTAPFGAYGGNVHPETPRTPGVPSGVQRLQYSQGPALRLRLGGVQGARTAKGIVAYAKANMPSLVKVRRAASNGRHARCNGQQATLVEQP
jgi:hypothetical protein